MQSEVSDHTSIFPKTPIRILLVDDHLMFRQGLKSLIEREKLDVVGEASDGREAVRLAEQLRPDVAVLDLAMPVLNGIDAAREIFKVSPKTKAILLTLHTEDHYMLEALQVGFKGCVLKTEAAADLVRAIQRVQQGLVYLSPSVSGTVVQAYLAKRELAGDPLSSRERQVLQLIAEGKRTKEIAVLLEISVKTAESHRARLMEKLNIHMTAGLVHYAIRRGLIQP